MTESSQKLVDLIFPPPKIKFPEALNTMAFMPISMRTRCPLCGEAKEENEWVCSECNNEYRITGINVVKKALLELRPEANIRVDDTVNWVPPEKLHIISDRAREIMGNGTSPMTIYEFAEYLSDQKEFEHLSFGILKMAASKVLKKSKSNIEEQVDQQIIAFVRSVILGEVESVKKEAWRIFDQYKPELGIEIIENAVKQIIEERKSKREGKAKSFEKRFVEVETIETVSVDFGDSVINRNLKENVQLAKAFLSFLEERFQRWKKQQKEIDRKKTVNKGVFAKEIGYNQLSWHKYVKDPEGYGISKTKAQKIAKYFNLTLKEAIVVGLRITDKVSQASEIVFTKAGKSFYLSAELLEKISKTAPKFAAFILE